MPRLGVVASLKPIHRGNVAAMDLGRLHTGLAVWSDGKPCQLRLFAAPSCKELCARLDESLHLLNNCNLILIEQQMASNFKAQQIQGWCEMWFALKVPQAKFVLFASKLKYSGHLQETKGKGYTWRKKWACKQAERYLQPYPEMAREFAQFKPQADVADAIVIGSLVL